jgi:outer membrane protein, heavy metal efflux system
MKILTMILTGIMLWGTTGPAWGGYRDLKKDLDNYAPPALLQPPPSPPPPSPREPDAFEAEIAAIRSLREDWEKAVAQTETTIGASTIQPAIVEAAADDARTAGLLKPRFSLEAAQALIALRNPSIRGAVQRFHAALEGFGQVTQLDEILRQYTAFTDAVKPGVGPMQGMDKIQMKFPFPGVTALKGQVAEKNVEAEKESLDLIRRDTIAKGRKAYWNLLYTHRARRITRDMLERLNQLESVATTRYGAGKTSYQDVAKIRIGREKLAEQLTTLNEQRVNAETDLLALMDLPPGTPIGVPETVAADASLPPLDELYPLALQNRQELRRMRAMVGKMERMVEMAETVIQPAFSQNYSLAADDALLQAGAVAMRPAFGTTISPTRGKGLPKNAWFGTRDAYLQETRRKLNALRDDLADAESRTQAMVRMAWFDLDRARRERALFQKRLLELAQTSLAVSTRGYESGRVTFADVIASYTGWFDIHLAGERRNSDLGIARAELERRVGAPLP